VNTRRVCFPLLGNYYVAEKTLGSLLGDEVIIPPRITKKTLEIGAKYSPEVVCVPFKYLLGNFIEALEIGANVLVQIGGGCRLGCYGEVQRAILLRLGYEFDFVKVTNDAGVHNIIRFIKQSYPQHSYVHICRVIYLAYEKAKAIDEIEDFVRKNVGFELQKGSFERLHRHFLAQLDQADTIGKVRDVKRRFAADFRLLKVEKPDRPLRVGFVGEFYVVLEPFSNFFIEKQLAQFGVEVHRPLTIAGTIRHYTFYDRHIQHLLADASPYLHHALGAHGTESVAQAVRFAKQGFDGMIHVKPFGCMPEINAMPALHHVSQDFRFPIVYFSFDALTSETGIKTRLEAFYDMLMMSRSGA
jgi:predicted nucleotide-binding protein (sugar kinase/HSP70/actin superfamily)